VIRSLVIVSLLFGAFPSGPFCEVLKTPNLLTNPGFEDSLEGWNNWGGVVSDKTRFGKSSLSISQQEPKWAGCDQRVFLSDGDRPARVILSGWMRTQEVVRNRESWEMARFVLNFYDEAGRMLGGYQPSAGEAQGTTDWRKYEREYLAPAGTRQIEVQCALANCVGEAFFDELHLEAMDESGRPLQRGRMTGPADEGEFWEMETPAAGEAGHWVDWSGLLDAPAGKHGRVKATQEGELVFSGGKPARFWGTNLVAQNCFPDRATAEATALRLSRMGCNLVRLHHMDAPWFTPNIFCNASSTRKLCPESLDRLDYFVYCLRQRGIYIYLDLLVHRDFLSADGVTDKAPDLGGKQVGLFSRRLIELQKEYARQIYSHVNPYTKLSYRDDPAVVASEVINESSLFMHFGGDILTEPYRKELDSIWKAKGNKGRLSVFEQDWSQGDGRMKERGEGGEAKRSVSFLAELENEYFTEMRKSLRENGVKSLLAGSNWAPTLATLFNHARMDHVISNQYWDHPQLWKINNDWGRVMWAPFDNRSQITSFENNSFLLLAYARAANKPFLVTEWNQCYPNEYRLEGVPLLAAYAALQGWNGFLQFDFAHDPVGSSSRGNFNLNNMPDHLAQWVVAAPLFLRGDVARAPGQVVENVTREQREGLPSYSEFLKIHPWVPYVTRYAKSYDDSQPSGSAGVTAYARHYDSLDRVVRSETGELDLDASNSRMTVRTARLQGVQGVLNGMEFDLPDVRGRVENSFASVFLVSADALPLATSGRMYLVVVGAVKTSGLTYNATRTQLTALGELPLLAQVIRGTVKLKSVRSGMTCRVRPMSLGGTPGEPVSVRIGSDGTTFSLDEGRTMVYEVVVSRRRQ
jgi:hypothetical protein